MWNSEFTHFKLAEAAATGVITGGMAAARVSLEAAIKNSMAKVTGFPATLGVTPSATYAANATTIAAYVSFVLAAYDAANDNGKLEIIMKEYYLSTWGNGWEAYNAYRLTGFPKNMQQTVYSATPGFFIRSFYYPSVYVNRNLNAPTQKALGAKVDKVF
ncbi:MAG: SusD/RagB family nutrient-binding outer membrane lipoprotein [Bacteroidetes bacterium]|nr:SusD/RagB family nutrient-binding outer membrane lipoprotein [Bacteroidota bacterium]